MLTFMKVLTSSDERAVKKLVHVSLASIICCRILILFSMVSGVKGLQARAPDRRRELAQLDCRFAPDPRCSLTAWYSELSTSVNFLVLADLRVH